MMVDSEQTNGTEGSAPEPAEASASGKTGRRQYRRGPVEDNAGWTIFSYLISGMAFYGLVGWLVGRATHIAVLFPLGAIVGLVLAIVLIIFRYGRA
jgi:hypothetical protein